MPQKVFKIINSTSRVLKIVHIVADECVQVKILSENRSIPGGRCSVKFQIKEEGRGGGLMLCLEGGIEIFFYVTLVKEKFLFGLSHEGFKKAMETVSENEKQFKTRRHIYEACSQGLAIYPH